MNSKIIQRYRKKSQPALLKLAQNYFNEFIRLRDRGQRCISCNKAYQHAGHFYSVGSYSALRFNEDNCSGQCIRCNYHLHGNLIEYRFKLQNKIGTERLNKLDELARLNKRKSHKWDKMTIIDKIETYKQKVKELK